MNEKKEKFQSDCSTQISRLNSNLKDILENLKIKTFPNYLFIIKKNIN